jgi:hypothetical protein
MARMDSGFFLRLLPKAGAFDLAVELRGAWFEIGVKDALVLDMPMEFGLEFMTVIGSASRMRKGNFSMN